MLGALSEKMQGIISKLAGKKKLSEENIAEAVSEVRLALLEADVNYSVAKTFIKRVQKLAVGDALIKSVTPGQQFIKLIHDELVLLMGGTVDATASNTLLDSGKPNEDKQGKKKTPPDETLINLSGEKPVVVMMCGLQGAGKTTHCAKLAKYLKKKGQCQNPMLAACDLQRPAAVEQLKVLGNQIGVPVFTMPNVNDPVNVAKEALAEAKKNGHDLLIVDTAGRLHIDDELMHQLEQIKKVLNPAEILFVANATTGQDAVNTAVEFHKRITITGTILTMLDGNARGGAAISIREMTGQPLKFEGIGEKVDDLQPFNPISMADRILGMGDTINLVRKAKEHIDEDDAKALEKKMRTATFTYDDYLKQIQMVKKMGSLKSLFGMLPGMSALKTTDFNEDEFFKVEAIIQSMTKDERFEKTELSVPRKKRIANGSGTKLEEINKLVKSFKQAKQFFKNMPNMKQLEKMMGGAQWR